MNANPTMKVKHPPDLSTSPAAANEPRVRVADETDTTTGSGEAISNKLACMIRDRPGISLAVAVALGGIAAWIIKRRE